MIMRWLDATMAPDCALCSSAVTMAELRREAQPVAYLIDDVGVQPLPGAFVTVLTVSPCGCQLRGNLAMVAARVMFRAGLPGGAS